MTYVAANCYEAHNIYGMLGILERLRKPQEENLDKARRFQ